MPRAYLSDGVTFPIVLSVFESDAGARGMAVSWCRNGV